MLFLLGFVFLKSTIRIRSIKDGVYMDDSGVFKPGNDSFLYVDYVFNYKGSPTMRILSPNGKVLGIKNESLFWKPLRGKEGTKWTYLPVEEHAGLIVSENGLCFNRFADEIKIQDCPDSKDDWTDCYLFSVQIGVDPEKINKCKRTVSRARDVYTEFECGKKIRPPPPKCKEDNPRKSSEYPNDSNYRNTKNPPPYRRNNRNRPYRFDEPDSYYDDDYSDSFFQDRDPPYNINMQRRGRERNFLIKNLSDETSFPEKKGKKNDQQLISSENDELFLMKNLFSKFKATRKIEKEVSNDE